MAETETYVTKSNPTVEDWIEYNDQYFHYLRGEAPSTEEINYAPLTDVDIRAEKEGISVEDYLVKVTDMVGPLGRGALMLVDSYFDDSTHIVAFPKPKSGQEG